MNQNVFSSDNEDPQKFLDKICCLKEDDIRCQRLAGNVTCSYSKNICNFISQLNLHMDDLVCIKLELFLNTIKSIT